MRSEIVTIEPEGLGFKPWAFRAASRYTWHVVWELVFMLVILKIPVVYLCAVVWWAIKAEPRPLEGAGTVASLGPGPACDWQARRASVRCRPAPLRGGGAGRRTRLAGARAKSSA